MVRFWIFSRNPAVNKNGGLLFSGARCNLMKMSFSRQNITIFTSILSTILISCSGMNPDPQTPDTLVSGGGTQDTTSDALPAGYIPSGWVEPVLFYNPDEYFPAEVTAYVQAPGQFANDSTYGISGNTGKLTGTPSGGGTTAPDNSSLISPGMAGGSVTVKFEPPIEDHADNIGGYDFIVFGNAYWYGGNPSNGCWQEPGVIWVMKDQNGNSDPDDTWYLIPGSHLSVADSPQDVIYDDTDSAYPPPEDKKSAWWPDGISSPLTINDQMFLPDELFSSTGDGEVCWGYADVTPTLKIGDMSGASGSSSTDNLLNDAEDYPEIEPVYFYTTPDTHGDDKIDAGTGGGDAIDISWAVDPDTFVSADLDEISWIRIAGATILTGTVGEFSPEIDGVARVRRTN